jgi:hypothetical protein
MRATQREHELRRMLPTPAFLMLIKTEAFICGVHECTLIVRRKRAARVDADRFVLKFVKP